MVDIGDLAVGLFVTALGNDIVSSSQVAYTSSTIYDDSMFQ